MRHQPPASRTNRKATPAIHSITTSGNQASNPAPAITSVLETLPAVAKAITPDTGSVVSENVVRPGSAIASEDDWTAGRMSAPSSRMAVSSGAPTIAASAAQATMYFACGDR